MQLPIGFTRLLSALLLPVAVCPQDFQTAQSSYSPGNSYSKQIYSSFIDLCCNFKRLEQFMNFHLYLDTDRIVTEVDLKRPHKPHRLAVSRAFQTYDQLIQWCDLVSTTQALQQIQELFE